MAIDLASASAELRLDVSNFVTNANRAADAANGIKQATDNATSGGFLGWVTDNEAALNRWGKGLLATGAIITGAFTAPVIAGSRAAWNQVDAVEQATVAMRAYVDDAEKVDQVLADLVAYARSDLGVLFQRQDLFEAAQSMLIYGASIDEVTGYVEIMSRSVGLGTGNWQDLNRIIGRIGSTGKITRDDFDMLTKAGYQLDSSIVGQTVTWQELFAILDQGIPADALAGQADTIRGKSIRLQSALRGLGLAFLGVDSETSKFIEGGLGWQMMRGMERLRSLFIAAAPAVGRFGDILAAIGRPLGTVFDLLLRLPQSVQSAILMFTAGTGVLMTFSGGLLLMLPRIASTVEAFRALGPAITAARVAMTGLFMNPAMLAAIAVIGAAILAYKTNFLGFGDMVRDAVEWVQDLWTALQMVFGTPSSKTITIYDDWQADKYTIQATTLDDGTKVWHIVEDETGETFGQILESYTDFDGTTYILIEPEGDGPAFWAKADLETGKPESIEIPIIGVDSDYQLTMDTILSATGNEVTVIIDGDGRPVGTVLDGIISDPVTGEKTITLHLGNGQAFIATVDATTGSIVLQREVEITADTGQLSEVEKLTGRINDMIRNIELAWLAVKWGVEGLVLVIKDIYSFVTGMPERISEWWDEFTQGIPYFDEIVELAGNFAEGMKDAYDWANDMFNLEPPGWLKWLAGVEENEWDGGPREGGEGGGGSRGFDEVPRGSREPREITRTPREGGSQGGMFKDAYVAHDVGNLLRQAAVNADLFTDSLLNLDLASLRSNQSLMKTASTVPMFTSSTREADQATGAMAGNMNRSFSDMARSALTNFTSMQSTATSRASSMQSSVLASVLGMQTRSAAQMALMASTTSTQTANMQSTATTNASTMASRVGGHMAGMRTAAALQMGLMASSASSTGSEMNTGLIGWMAGAIARVSMNMALMVASVRNAGSSGYDAGYYAGSMIGAGMAAGMNAYLGQIRASANSMVAAASTAVIARAMISSPSRLFMQYGEYMGEGLEIGMRNMIPAIDRAAGDMVPQPAFNTPIGHGGYGGGTTVIDNSTHTETYVALNDQQFAELLAAKDKANIVHDAMTNRHSASQYGGGRR